MTKEITAYIIAVVFAILLLIAATVASVITVGQAFREGNIVVGAIFVILGFSAAFSAVVAGLIVRDLKRSIK